MEYFKKIYFCPFILLCFILIVLQKVDRLSTNSTVPPSFRPSVHGQKWKVRSIYDITWNIKVIATGPGNQHKRVEIANIKIDYNTFLFNYVTLLGKKFFFFFWDRIKFIIWGSLVNDNIWIYWRNFYCILEFKMNLLVDVFFTYFKFNWISYRGKFIL